MAHVSIELFRKKSRKPAGPVGGQAKVFSFTR